MLFVAVPFRELDVGFVPDDTYYVLAIARSLAAGEGPRADAVHLTNGFQPLIAFLLVPLFWFAPGPHLPVYAAATLGAVADSGVAWLLRRLAAGAWGRLAGESAGWLWALAPIAVANALCGLETSLALLLLLALANAAGRLLDGAAGGSAARVGALAGLALLARVDAAFLCALVGAAVAWRRGPQLAARVAGVAAAVVAPWWLYELIRFGTVVPESGASVRLQASLHVLYGMTPLRQTLWALSYGLMPTWDWHAGRDWILAGPAAAALAALAVASALWFLVRPALVTATPAVRMLGLTVALLTPFYALYVPAVWFFKRYLAPLEAVAVLLLAHFCSRVDAGGRRRVAACALAVALVAPGALQLASWRLAGKPRDLVYHGVKGYEEAADAILDRLSARGTPVVLGAFQSGALAYFSGAKYPGVRVVNLDGVVNGDAYRALRAGRLFEFARAAGVTHVADWRLNLDAMARFSSNVALPPVVLEFTAPPQGNDRFLVGRILWPANEPASGAIAPSAPQPP